MRKQALVIPAVSYDEDFFAWTQQTAELLEQRRFDEIDLEHAAEEIADMGKRDRREIRSRLTVLVAHLLKWQAQPELRDSASWRSTIVEQRREIELLLADSPSLRRVAREELSKIYADAARYASREAGLAVQQFPARCPYTFEQILDGDFLPG